MPSWTVGWLGGAGLVVTTMGLVLTHERMPQTQPLPDLFLDNVK